MNLPHSVTKYLNKYASTKWKAELNVNLNFDCIIVVPAIKESENIPILLNSLSKNVFDKRHKVLILFVINNSVSSSQEIKNDNKKTIEYLRTLILNDSSELKEKLNLSGLFLGLVDASSNGLEMPDKFAGVGFARKIGMDAALTLFDYQSLKKKILLCLDADCKVAKNYIEEVISSFNEKNINAAVIKYEHSFPDDEEETKAIICYEIFLRYYVLGLKYAGSEYAFHTIGSAMACVYEAYIKIEGMNKQKAAEDFYFLEKLAKHYKIHQINSTVVYPSARKSWRVPFGTGQRMNRFISKTHNEYLLYHPESFEILKKWLNIFNNDEVLPGENYLQKANDIHPELCKFLNDQNFKESWEKILLNSKNNLQINLQKHRWFDGFRILKLIHHLRDTAYPMIDMFDALDEMFAKQKINFDVKRMQNEIPSIEIQKKYLFTLRKLDS